MRCMSGAANIFLLEEQNQSFDMFSHSEMFSRYEKIAGRHDVPTRDSYGPKIWTDRLLFRY